MTKPITLNASQVESYKRDGFLIAENLLSREEVAAFLEHQKNKQKDVDPGLRSHVVDARWAYLAKHPNVAGVVAHLLGGRPCILQSMYLPKYAGETKEKKVGIALHQDAHYLPTKPNTLMACWIAMSDTSAENGGLCVVPGSHHGELYGTNQASSDEHVSWRQEYLMRDRSGKEWTREFYSFEIDGLEPQSIQRLTVPKGGGVFFTGMTIHGSYANNSPTNDRLAFAVHYVREGTWCLRADVQETVLVSEYSREA
jgi:ectoine hydroxylase-related dioxygenase (phytanoyl-CoA dioxygenase family)